jgi:hypothetical protein
MNHAHQIVSQHPSLKYGSVWEIRPVGDLSEIRKASEHRRRKDTRDEAGHEGKK